MKRGRRRQINPDIPAHIEQGKLPDYCYWDKQKSHWYTIQRHPDRKPTRHRIAGKSATLGDLHKIMEEISDVERDTFKWLSGLYKESAKFTVLANKTQKNYEGSEKILVNHPTKLNKPLGTIPLHLWDNPLVQKLIDKITTEHGPAAANHCLVHIRIVFNWGKNRGHCKYNPGEDIDRAKERKLRRLPSKQTLNRLIMLAQERGGFLSHKKGSCTPYLWPALVIGYECRLRGIETNSLTDAHLLDEGLLCERTKGSRTNITTWNDNLRQAVSHLQKRRSEIWGRKKRPAPINSRDRYLFVNETGGPLAKSSLDSAFTRFMQMAINEGVITEEQRFGLHDLKRRGTTDTKGTRADKQEATGHKSASMMEIYDYSIPVVKPVSE